MSGLEFAIFSKEHYQAYNEWFRNERIKKALFDIDGNWLDFVLSDKTGIEYAIFEKNEMVAVVGVIRPTKTHPTYGIKNIAVNPKLFRQGMGSRVVKKLLRLHSLKEGEYWIAFVDVDNPSAQRFFEKNGWEINHSGEAGDNMIRYEKRD